MIKYYFDDVNYIIVKKGGAHFMWLDSEHESFSSLSHFWNDSALLPKFLQVLIINKLGANNE